MEHPDGTEWIGETRWSLSGSTAIGIDFDDQDDEWYGPARWDFTLWAHEPFEDDEVEVKAGTVSLYVGMDMRHDPTFFDRWDSLSQDTSVVAGALARGGAPDGRFFGEPLEDARIVVMVDDVWVDPKYRGRQISHRAVDAALTIALGDSSALVALIPAVPHDPPGMATQEERDALARHWRRGGFVHVADGVMARPYDWWYQQFAAPIYQKPFARWRRRVRRPWPAWSAVEDEM